VILACEIREIVEHARQSDCVLEMVPQVGDFIGRGDPLFRLVRGEWSQQLSPAALRRLVAIGQERSLEQDPAFAFRIMVDIAAKALSPAINDPTTAVRALDQVHSLLRLLGKRELRGEVLNDESGTPRLVFRTPDWDDFVNVACREIRACGGDSMQVVRRMRAMLQNLARTVPERRRPSVDREMRLLDLTVDASFALPEDRELARIADPQGLGGSAANARVARRAP
jgi:uncharacterized membrane protein